jgi:hypothetical protein
VGKLQANGSFKYGSDGYQSVIQRSIVETNFKGFVCAAVSETILAVGSSASGSGCLLFFAVGGEEQYRGKFFLKVERLNCVVRRVFFNTDGTELAALFAFGSEKKEVLEVFTVARSFVASSGPRPAISPQANVSPDCSLPLDMAYIEDTVVYSYTTRDGRFSFDGRKIVLCTKHERGSVLVFILAKDDQNIWRINGRQCLHIDLDDRDEDRLGFTGVSLYVTPDIPLLKRL